MRPRAAILLLAAIVLTIAACRDDDPSLQVGTTTSSASATTSAPPATDDAPGQAIEVSVAGSEVSGVDDRVSVAAGSRVTISVAADTTDHVHVHGYDLLADVAPGSPATIDFTADLPGVWEVELEEAGLLLFQLEVQ